MQKSCSKITLIWKTESTSNFGPATGFKSQIPYKTYHLQLPILPVIAQEKNSLQDVIF